MGNIPLLFIAVRLCIADHLNVNLNLSFAGQKAASRVFYFIFFLYFLSYKTFFTVLLVKNKRVDQQNCANIFNRTFIIVKGSKMLCNYVQIFNKQAHRQLILSYTRHCCQKAGVTFIWDELSYQ